MWRPSRMKTEGSPAVSRRAALLALVGLMLLLLVPLPSQDGPDPIMEDLKNLLHVPLFMVVTLLFRALQRPAVIGSRGIWPCAVAAGVLGLLSESVQGLTGRTPSVADLGADLAGILLACAVVLPRGAPRGAGIIRWTLVLAGACLFALAAVPLVGEISSWAAKRGAFPVLIDPGMPGGLWQGQGGTRLSGVGREPAGLEVEMARGDYEGLRYGIPRGVDTKGYTGLVIETSNAGDGFELGVRIDMTSGARKNAAVVVPRGSAVLEVGWVRGPGDGELRRVVLFTGENQEARRFRLLDARLVRGAERMVPSGP